MPKLIAEIYCKIYTDTFPYINGAVTYDYLYEYLLQDCGHAFIEDGNSIKGDKIIWYLGSNEKFGNIKLETKDGKVFEKDWGFGESSFNIVRKMLTFCLINNIFNIKQFNKLLEEVIIGESINSMYQIKDYLQCKADGKVWKCKDDNMRNDIKSMMDSVKKHLNDKGYTTIFANRH